jgi:sarcosine oxidase subunit alpha
MAGGRARHANPHNRFRQLRQEVARMNSRSKRLASGGRIGRSSPSTSPLTGKNCAASMATRSHRRVLANDVALVGRSFKYHRPRGIFFRRPRRT